MLVIVDKKCDVCEESINFLTHIVDGCEYIHICKWCLVKEYGILLPSDEGGE